MKLLLMLLSIPLLTHGQNGTMQDEIDNQIWNPFIKSYRDFDYVTFNNLHSDDLIRINSKEIRNAKTYKTKNKDWFIRAKKEGYKQSISFQFEKRIVTDNMAFETGYYEIKITKPDDSKSEYYARFHVLLKKEHGVWKITQDWDSNAINGVKVTANDFYNLKNDAGSEKKVVILDFVKIINKKKEEALYYYENNWKSLRAKAKNRGYILSYQLLVNDDEIILITEYENKNSYDKRELNFSLLMNEYQSSGPVFLNDLRPTSFRKNVSKKTATAH
ncbi:nuclear transport factor 2 family protein [uncultured Psychroserpens sp.]|uniref:YybH family protein n=1 Tax=uncultured Psychroserpens sp. TaxID=255436 RepID=UPI002621671B|nr:nuclear transport factor 2 family protein [uncultured Psychroserpens sp.]